MIEITMDFKQNKFKLKRNQNEYEWNCKWIDIAPKWKFGWSCHGKGASTTLLAYSYTL